MAQGLERQPDEAAGVPSHDGAVQLPLLRQHPEGRSDPGRRDHRRQRRPPPAFGQTEYAVTVAGLTAFLAYDLWGAAKNTQLYIKATTLRLAEGGGVILCARSDVQRAVSEFYAKYPRSSPTTRRAAASR